MMQAAFIQSQSDRVQIQMQSTAKAWSNLINPLKLQKDN